MKRNILAPRDFYKPFEYIEAYKFYEQHERMHWLPTEVPLHQDVLDWKTKLTDGERNFLTQIFRLFTQSDIDVAGAYATKYLPLFPKPEIRMMLLSFAAREATHIQAYSHLIDTLGMPETTYKAFMEYEAMKEKHELIESFMGTDQTRIVQQIAAFSAFTEGMQLFSSFIMLLNFTRFNKMNGMGQIITWSIKDESCLIKGTQVLTLRGWKAIEDVEFTDNVAQYDYEKRSITFVQPTKQISSQAVESYEFESGVIHQHVTADHRMATHEGFMLAKDCNNMTGLIQHGVKYDGLDDFEEEDAFMIESIVCGDIDKQWIYDKIPQINSYWARAAIEHYQSYLWSIDQDTPHDTLPFETLAYLAGGILDHNLFKIGSNINKTNITKHAHPIKDFYCLTVPSGAFVVRSNGKISVTGNCHVDGMTWLFKEFLKEHKSIWTDTLKHQLYTLADQMVVLEDKFIDLAFEMGPVEGLTIEQVKKYIRYITDRRLIGLGMKGIFKIKTNPIPWVEELLGAPEHSSFFETVGTSYAKGSLTGDWGNVWK